MKLQSPKSEPEFVQRKNSDIHYNGEAVPKHQYPVLDMKPISVINLLDWQKNIFVAYEFFMCCRCHCRMTENRAWTRKLGRHWEWRSGQRIAWSTTTKDNGRKISNKKRSKLLWRSKIPHIFSPMEKKYISIKLPP